MAIWRPTNDTPLTPLRTPFGLLADSVEADLDARGFTRYATKALMDANTTAADGRHATVYADGTPANNGDYVAKGGVWSPYRTKALSNSASRTTDLTYGTGQTSLGMDATISAAPAGKYHMTGRMILKSTVANAGSVSYFINGAAADTAVLDGNTVVTHVPIDYIFIHAGGNLTVGVADTRTAGTTTCSTGSRLSVIYLGAV